MAANDVAQHISDEDYDSDEIDTQPNDSDPENPNAMVLKRLQDDKARLREEIARLSALNLRDRQEFVYGAREVLYTPPPRMGGWGGGFTEGKLGENVRLKAENESLKAENERLKEFVHQQLARNAF